MSPVDYINKRLFLSLYGVDTLLHYFLIHILHAPLSADTNYISIGINLLRLPGSDYSAGGFFRITCLRVRLVYCNMLSVQKQ